MPLQSFSLPFPKVFLPFYPVVLVLLQNFCAGKFAISRKFLGNFQEFDLSIATVRAEGLFVALTVLVVWLSVMWTSKKYYIDGNPAYQWVPNSLGIVFVCLFTPFHCCLFLRGIPDESLLMPYVVWATGYGYMLLFLASLFTQREQTMLSINNHSYHKKVEEYKSAWNARRIQETVEYDDLLNTLNVMR